jgi:ATP-dependent Clp protease ATP-binding subunit ClpA
MFSAAVEGVLEAAYREAVRRRHAHLTLEHLLFALSQDGTAVRILTASGANVAQLHTEIDVFLDQVLEKLPANSTQTPIQTLAFRRVLQVAILHVQSSGRGEADVGDLIAAMLQQPRSHAAQLLAAHGITRLDVLNFISHGIAKIPLEDEAEDAPAAVGEEERPKVRDPLAAYTINLTDRARQGQLDPLIGRMVELRRALEILCRRRKNNPVFVGDAGVGKTALVEGLAQRLIESDVPEILGGAEIFALDTGALLAGTRFRGDFEERFKMVVAALKKRPRPILFIDEMHTMVGAGAVTGGTMDLANLVKPILTEGDLRLVGSTTFEEFKHLEKDRALFRRVQKIAVNEPSHEETIKIIKGLKSRYEEHHGITYTSAAIEAAARLAGRHLRDYRLPDSALDVLDEAGAMVRLTITTEGGETKPIVDVTEVERVVARMAHIPEKQASASDKERLRTLGEALRRVVFGQEEAVHLVTQAIKRSRAGLGQPERPVGCFLFTGPTGVGKTELARQLALHLGNEFYRYDMSEYMEKHAVARLIGAPPGYVGFEQGGLLVDAVRTHPYAVVLMDEIEKAHPDLFGILLQVMDHATLTDNNGRKADFRHVILIMTSNAGSREISAAAIGFGKNAGLEAVSRGTAAIERLFTPEFRNRLDAIVSFQALTPEVMETIVDKFILQLEAQLRERRVALTLTPEARRYLARKGHDTKYGARPLARIIQTEVRDPLTDEVLFGNLERGGTATIGFEDEKLRFTFEPSAPTAIPTPTPVPAQ